MIRKLMASSAMLALMTAGAIGVAQAQTQPVNPAQPPARTQDQATDPAAPAGQDPAAQTEAEQADEPTAEIAESQTALTPEQPTLATAFIGKSVFSTQDPEADNIGNVNDLIISEDGTITHAVVGVGGFLGIGEKNVAVPFDELEVMERDGDLRLIYAATREELEQAQAFDAATYEPQGRAQQAQQQQAAQQNATGMGAGGTAMDPATNQQAATTTAPATTTTEPATTTEPQQQTGTNTTVVTVPATDPNAQQQQTAETQVQGGATATGMQQAEGFMSYSATDQVRASTLMGQEIFGAENESIGEVSDLVVQPDGNTRAALIDVGGFLGVGEKQVAIPFDQIQMTQDGNQPRLTVAMTREQLEQAPAYEAPEEMAQQGAQPPAEGQQATATAPADPNQPAAPADPNQQQAAAEPVPATQDLSADNLMGQAVYGSNDENLGEVGDVVFTPQGEIQAVVIDVGGFLGIGQKPVAITFDQLNVQKETNGELRLQVNATQEQLEAAPSYDVEQATAQ